MKKWYDYLWIASLVYLALGFFQYPICMVGADLLLHSADPIDFEGKQDLLQPLLRARAVIWLAGRSIRPLSEEGHAALDEEQDFPLLFSGVFFCDVLSHALEHLSGICRGEEPEAGCHAPVDIQATMALGLSRNTVSYRRCAVRLWILQRNAYVHCAGAFDDGAV